MKQEAKVLIGIGSATIAILAIATFMLNKSFAPLESTVSPASEKLLLGVNSHQTATASAKVTVVEFGDYQCPACKAAYPVAEQILKEYSGKINFVFRNFPLAQHKYGLLSAEAAEAAAAQGKFWEMHKILYENQENWSESTKPQDLFAGYAKDLELDVDRFNQDINANKYSDIITQDRTDGISLGVNVTPTFFINGKKAEGIPEYADFKRRIDLELNK